MQMEAKRQKEAEWNILNQKGMFTSIPLSSLGLEESHFQEKANQSNSQVMWNQEDPSVYQNYAYPMAYTEVRWFYVDPNGSEQGNRKRKKKKKRKRAKENIFLFFSFFFNEKRTIYKF